MIAGDEYVPDRSVVSSPALYPGCYDLYVEDEWGCSGLGSTGGYLDPGLEFTWTVYAEDLVCYTTY